VAAGAMLALRVMIWFFVGPAAPMGETERVAEWTRRGYASPPRWTPATPGWKRVMDRRAAQLYALESSQERWDGWTTVAASGLVVKNFTAVGYEVAAAPAAIVDDLRAQLRAGLAAAPPEDTPGRPIDVIAGSERPKFVALRPGTTEAILEELLPTFEAWAGVPLRPAIAYGLRAYRGGASLKMHIDKIEDHVVSAILHVDHDDDARPWPLVIEGFDGRTAEVVLEKGEMLFYESAKCLHGRPRPFVGDWYSSIFIHYVPRDWGLSGADAAYAVPPDWGRAPAPSDGSFTPLRLVGTGLYEPECADAWCGVDGDKPPTALLRGAARPRVEAHRPRDDDDDGRSRAAPARAKEGDDDDDAAVRRVTYDHGEDRWMLHAGVVVVLFGGAVGGSLRQRGFPRPRRKKEF